MSHIQLFTLTSLELGNNILVEINKKYFILLYYTDCSTNLNQELSLTFIHFNLSDSLTFMKRPASYILPYNIP